MDAERTEEYRIVPLNENEYYVLGCVNFKEIIEAARNIGGKDIESTVKQQYEKLMLFSYKMNPVHEIVMETTRRKISQEELNMDEHLRRERKRPVQLSSSSLF